MTRPTFIVTWVGLALACYWCFDEAVAFYIRENLPKSASSILKQISKLGIAGYYLAGFLLFYGFARYIQRNPLLTKIAVYLSSCVLFPGIFCDILKICFGRYRPRLLFSDQLYGFHFFTLKSKMWSFPSGHSVTIMGLMVGLSFLFPRHWGWFWLFGIAISLTRVLVTAHFMSDVMVGMYIGTLGAMLCYAWFSNAQFVENRLLLPARPIQQI